MMNTRCASLLLVLGLSAGPALAQDLEDLGPGPTPEQGVADQDREPASVNPAPRKRAYPGAADEEDLRVQATLPEASLKVDARGLQREVYKQLFNQELKEESQNDLEE